MAYRCLPSTLLRVPPWTQPEPVAPHPAHVRGRQRRLVEFCQWARRYSDLEAHGVAAELLQETCVDAWWRRQSCYFGEPK